MCMDRQPLYVHRYTTTICAWTDNHCMCMDRQPLYVHGQTTTICAWIDNHCMCIDRQLLYVHGQTTTICAWIHWLCSLLSGSPIPSDKAHLYSPIQTIRNISCLALSYWKVSHYINPLFTSRRLLHDNLCQRFKCSDSYVTFIVWSKSRIKVLSILCNREIS